MIGRALVLALLLLAAPAWAWEGSGVKVPDPPGWERREGEAGALVRFYAPKGPGPRASLGVSARDLGEVEDLTREHVHDAVRTLAAEVEGFHLLGSRPEQVQGRPGHRLAYKAKLGGHAFRVTQVMLVRTGRLYVLTLATPEDAHAKCAPVLEKALAGLEITATE